MPMASGPGFTLLAARALAAVLRFIGKALSSADDGEEPRYDLLSIRKGDFKVFYRLAFLLWAAALAHYARRTVAENPPAPAGYTWEYLADVAAQTVAAFQGVAIGLAIIAMMATPFIAYTGRKMMAIAEIIHKKWVEPILSDTYSRGLVDGQVKGRVEGRSDADQEWEAWLTRRDAAIANGEPFDEPPPNRRR